jgi:hypothetical protein
MGGLQGGAAAHNHPLDAPDLRSLACDFWPDYSGQQRFEEFGLQFLGSL